MSDTLETPTTLAAIGRQLVENGYRIVPIVPGEKRPAIAGWQNADARADTLAEWIADGMGGYGVGVLGEETPGVDLDISAPGVLAKVLEWCREHIGATPQRVGRAPRVLLPCRSETPIAKFASRKFRSADGSTHQIEIIGKGGQYVAFARHPLTGKPYEWQDTSPANSPVDLLPELTAEKARELCAYFESLAPASWVPVSRAREAADAERTGNAKKTAPLSVVRSALDAMSNDDRPYEEWVRVAYALWAAVGEAKADGCDLFHEWSARSEKYDIEATEAAWAGIKRVDHIGAGTLFHLASAEGWTRPRPSAAEEFEPLDIDVDDITEDVRAKLAEAAAKAKPRRGVHSIDFGEAASAAFAEDAEPLIRGILDQGALAVMFGPPNAGKTFVALETAAAVATGRPWNGREVTRGSVLYIASETGRGIFRRFAALQKAHNLPADTPLRLVPCTVDLFSADGDLTALQRECARTVALTGLPLRLVVIDTLARTLGGGDESSGPDMGVYVGNVVKLVEPSKAAALIVHHTGKDIARGMRGHSSLMAAIDTALETKRAKNATVGTVECAKERDLPWFDDMKFRLEVVPLGADARGNERSSCVVRWLDAASEFDAVDISAVPVSLEANHLLETLKAFAAPATVREWESAHCRAIDPAWREGVVRPCGCSIQNLRKHRQDLRESGHVREIRKGVFEPTGARTD